jgi:hypothetical protein
MMDRTAPSGIAVRDYPHHPGGNVIFKPEEARLDDGGIR